MQFLKAGAPTGATTLPQIAVRFRGELMSTRLFPQPIRATPYPNPSERGSPAAPIWFV